MYFIWFLICLYLQEKIKEGDINLWKLFRKQKRLFSKFYLDDLNALVLALKNYDIEYMITLNIDNFLTLTMNTKDVKTKNAVKKIKD